MTFVVPLLRTLTESFRTEAKFLSAIIVIKFRIFPTVQSVTNLYAGS